MYIKYMLIKLFYFYFKNLFFIFLYEVFKVKVDKSVDQC
jgi:hypothetical protein